MRTSVTVSVKHTGLIFLFGLIFFFVGCTAAYFIIVRPLGIINRAQSWVETPARILDIKLKKSSGSEGGTTYGIDIRYEYEFNGKTYSSERFNSSSGTDNISDYHQRNFRHYKSLHDKKQPITCYVNPDDPDYAIIDRAPRFETIAFGNIFAFAFPLVGLFIMLSAIANHRAAPAPDACKIPLSITPLYVFIIPAAATLAYTCFLGKSLFPFLPTWPWYIWLLGLPAVILTLVCIRRVFYAIANGGSCLDLAQPAALGETRSASVIVPGEVTEQPVIVLRCKRDETVRTTRRSRGKNSSSTSTHTTFPWQAEAPATAYYDGRNSTISFRVALPADATPTSSNGSNIDYTWQVVAKFKRSRRTQTLIFPFHANPASAEALARGAGTVETLPQADDFACLAPLLRDERITLNRLSAQRFEIVFRRSGAGISLIGCTILFLIVGIFATLLLSQILPLCEKYFWMGAGVLMLTAPSLIVFVLTPARGIVCDTAARVFTLWSKRRFFTRAEHNVPYELVESFEDEVKAESTGGSTWRVIRLHASDDVTHTVSSLIGDAHAAKTLADFLSAQLTTAQ